ncbi:CocE/NonD family hydrolase [Jatrophihabitans fulvus]
MPLLVVGAVAVLVAALAVGLVVTRDGGGQKPVDSVRGAVPITMSDGVELGAQVTRPSGGGRHPLVVMPSSYGSTSEQYAAIAKQLTASGFATVSYTQRGFENSGGRIDLAGPRTQRDARTVIDWAVRNTAADPAHIGMLGVSYGAVVSLLTAAQDPRVRAVVAFSGWSDLAAVFHPHDTTSVLGLGGLLSNARVDSELTRLGADLKADPFGNAGELVSFARPRSPVTHLDGLNRSRPAIMLASGWQDSLLAPAPLVPFFDRLAGPKRLQLSIGDHGGPESDMLAGRSSRTGDAAYAWLAHHLQGDPNGIDAQPRVQLQDVTTREVHTYAAWPRAKRVALALGAPAPTGVSAGGTATAWRASLTTGTDSAATAGASQFVPSAQYRVPAVRPARLSPDAAFVWNAGAVPSATRLLGSPRLTLDVASSSPQATVFAYLYDTGSDGTGYLMSTTPFTATGLSQNRAKSVAFDLEPIDWTLAPGRFLTVVVDTVEPRWYQAAAAGSTLTLSSSAARPAALSVPVG